MATDVPDNSSVFDIDPERSHLKRKRQDSGHWQEPIILFHVGEESRQTPQSEFLAFIWGTGLDSDCMICEEPFHPQGSPPIRTVSLEQSSGTHPRVIDITQEPIAPGNLRIFNRHLSCMKAQDTNYIPISHAWHEEVAIAQDLHIESLEASRLVYQTPVKTLLALTEKFPDAEIWHDYLSVPQWQSDIQGRLLLAIPEIYNHAEHTVIHLDDVKADHLAIQTKKLPYDRFIIYFSGIIRSRWFDRMWVALEYMQSNRVIVLTEDYTISNATATELCHLLDATHSKWVKERSISEVTQDIWKQKTTLKRMTSWIDMEAWKNEQDMHKTFGWAIGILGHRQWRHQKDYLLALGKMLDFQPVEDPLVIVKDHFAYFFSLASHALLQDDYTSLLFIPPSEEKPERQAPWLRGHSASTWKLWDLGRCHQKAIYLPIVTDGRIKPRLESVGVLEWFELYGFESDAELVVDHVLSKVVRASGHDPEALCAAMDRIFPLDEKKGVYGEWRHAGFQNHTDYSKNYDLVKLRGYLEEYSSLLYFEVEEEVVQRRLGVTKKLISALKLKKKGKYAKESRLDNAAGEAEWFHREYGRAMEGIAQVSCKICGRRAVYRMTMWEKPMLDATQLYRIPGLLYDDSVPEGVGIVVDGGRIIGKTMYGTPACKCARLQYVELGRIYASTTDTREM